MKKLFQKAFILPLILILAVGLVVFKVKTKAPIEHERLEYAVKTVEVITAKKLPFRSRATAYGNVEPAVLLKAKSEVGGKISYIHPNLKKGGSIAKDTVVLRIEPTTFEFSLDQNKAGLSGSQSSLKQLQAEERSARRSLKIAKENLQVEKKEYARIRKIWDKRLIARSAVDAEEQKVLQQRQQVEELEGKIASYASRKSATKAQIKQSKTKIAQSKDTLGRTEIKMPFDARVGSVFVEKGEFTPIGNVLFEALGTKAIEINAQMPTRQFRPLLISLSHASVNMEDPKGLQSIVANLQLEANVSLAGSEDNFSHWQGKLLRIGESIDPTRDTIGLVVAVNNPYEGVIPGKRPPLLKGMYTAVEFIAPAQNMLVLPRKAIHQGRVYVASEDNYLEIRNVHILHKQGELVIVEGVEEGEKIIVTDVIPVINGLPLKQIEATEYEELIAQAALGTSAQSHPKEGTTEKSEGAEK